MEKKLIYLVGSRTRDLPVACPLLHGILCKQFSKGAILPFSPDVERHGVTVVQSFVNIGFKAKAGQACP
jgi:hypothetical protein